MTYEMTYEENERRRNRSKTNLNCHRYITRKSLRSEVQEKLMSDFGGQWYIDYERHNGKWFVTFDTNEQFEAAKKFVRNENKKFRKEQLKNEVPLTSDQKMVMDFFTYNKKHKIKW